MAVCVPSGGLVHRVFVRRSRFSHAVVIASSVYARSRKEPVGFSVKLIPLSLTFFPDLSGTGKGKGELCLQYTSHRIDCGRS